MENTIKTTNEKLSNEEILQDLMKQKAEAVASENFEEAIRIRDKIKEIEAKNGMRNPQKELNELAKQKEQEEFYTNHIKTALKIKENFLSFFPIIS